MADRRRHRGPHPEDRNLFSRAEEPRLKQAGHDLSWLLSHGYAVDSSLKLVGDRYELSARQRLAVRRSSCSRSQRHERSQRQVPAGELRGETVEIDGFNLLMTVEMALSGGVLLMGQDGCLRDMASMHGNYRNVEETLPAVLLIGNWLEQQGIAAARWFLDQPVSNSGRLRSQLQAQAGKQRWNWSVVLCADPDEPLSRTESIVVSADSGILDAPVRWTSAAAEIVFSQVSDAWIIRFDNNEKSPD